MALPKNSFFVEMTPTTLEPHHVDRPTIVAYIFTIVTLLGVQLVHNNI
jgi:hypothetical protein